MVKGVMVGGPPWAESSVKVRRKGASRMVERTAERSLEMRTSSSVRRQRLSECREWNWKSSEDFCLERHRNAYENSTKWYTPLPCDPILAVSALWLTMMRPGLTSETGSRWMVCSSATSLLR